MAEMTVRVRKFRDVFLVDAGNIHFSATLEELQQFENALQTAIISEREEAKHG